MPGRSKEEYLETIYGLKEDGLEAKTGQIAKAMGVKDASVSEMLKKLDQQGYISHQPYHGVRLTKKGLKVASKMKRKHRLLERFLHDILKIKKERVHNQACEMEHSLSDEAAEALDKLMDHPKTCPDDGKPIPESGKAQLVFSLTSLKTGQSAKIFELKGGQSYKSRMRALGVKEGKKARLIAREPLGGPVVIKIDNTKLTIGRGMAEKIKVSTG